MSVLSIKNISILNGSVLKKILNNLVSQGGLFAGKWVFNFTLSKLLSPSLFGLFTLLQALANFFMNLFSFGAVSHLIHEISGSQAQAFFKLVRSLRLTFKIALISSGIWLLAYIFNLDIPHLNLYFWPISIAVILSVNAQLYSFFKGLGQFNREISAAALFGLSSIIICSVLWATGAMVNIHYLLGLFSALQCVILLKGCYDLNQWKSKETSFLQDHEDGFMKERIPFGLHEIQGAIYIHAILLILGFMVPEEQLAIYRSVQLFVTPVMMIPGIVAQVLLNKLSGLKEKPLEQLTFFRKFTGLVMVSGLMIGLIYFLFGAELIHSIYNERYEFTLVQYLTYCFTAAFILRFFSANYGVILTSAGKQSIRVIMTFLSIVVSILMTYFLTAAIGLKGAALAAVCSFGVITVGYVTYCEAVLFKKLRKKC